MNNRLFITIGAAALVLLIGIYSSVFTVNEAQQALVVRFGNPVREVREAGLHMKVPFIDNVAYFDKRVLDYDASSVELILGDQKRLVVDAFARYRINSPTRFRQAAGDEEAFRSRLGPILSSNLRGVLGEVGLMQVLSTERSTLMQRIREQTNRSMQGFGVELVDLRIKRADLPEQNSQAIFQRMQTERQREANELRAQGAEVAQRIRSRADRERRVLIADAQRQAEVFRGEGDAEATRIFGEAFGADQDFYQFYRSMQAYRQSLADGRTNMVISPDSEFFRFFNQPNLSPESASPAPAVQGNAAAAPVDEAGADPTRLGALDPQPALQP
ncbi:MAG TPA: protease modulator HflC [Geminicoccus sp.]|jgi:membrane protease subunit HflC|uniref:protease modulator HflC n=1 Tax=Geminicoccus sp. TaxID=2024832 RepID=UPI002E2FA5D8|nr:protease modulator HflC [Geminicoccus sp.]HEX2527278.1 protease modulator HflC [Geminicoccus sp.]